jgi:hypothetical protein
MNGKGVGMTTQNPVTTLQAAFSNPGATPVPWGEAIAQLEQAELYWLTTVRPEGRPHVTPLIAVWLDGALHFCVGTDERKAKNIATNAACAITTGCNTLNSGRDLVIEGQAERVEDGAILQRLADAYEAKYGSDWHFDVHDGAFRRPEDGNIALVFAIAPQTAFGFSKGEPFSQTRWRF